MDKQLLARRQLAEDTFNKLATQKEQKQKEIDEIDTEMARLQGEYRLVNELLEPKKVSKKANEIDATSVEGA